MDRMKETNLIEYRSNRESLISGAPTTKIVDLGNHGFADSFFRPDQKELATFAFPLICRLDTESGLVQAENLTNSMDRYGLVDYSYTSSNSITSQNHWRNFLKDINLRKKLKESMILEIGSNDGYLLGEAKKNYTPHVLGVDASPFMVELANSKGILSLNGVFGETKNLEDNIRKHYSEFDFIFANNVLNHSNSPIEFLKNVGKFLKKDGMFIFEVPYWLSTIKSLRFDQIYHEHVTYLTIESSSNLLQAAGLSIIDVEIVDYHGGSIRVYAGHAGIETSTNLINLLQKESKYKLKEIETYTKYMSKIDIRKTELLALIGSMCTDYTVFGIGAAAKANTFLTYYGFSSVNMAFLLDSSQYKVGKLTPVTQIPIIEDENVMNIGPGLGLILAWNLASPLKAKLLELNSELVFING